ncbi:MAG: capsule biosynthesis protein [Burkholderiaceae bacterium]
MDGSLILHRLGARRRVLLLQGPGGLFFRKLAHYLRSAGCDVLQVNFNGGDEFFNSSMNTISFRQAPDQWPAWLEALVWQERIESIVLFGDCRPMHRAACRVAESLERQVLVFEEGYVRPGFVTCEADGVNARSPVAARFVQEQPPLLGLMPLPNIRRIRMPKVGKAYRVATQLAMGTQAALYLLAMRVTRHRYPHYVHHKTFRLREEIRALLVSCTRKAWYRITQTPLRRALYGDLGRKSFVVPLQVFNDSQITHHSLFVDQEQLVHEAIRSFARGSQAKDHLVFKHHPMDRGHRHYGRIIQAIAKQQGVSDRVHYIHDLRLPKLLPRTRGVVTINSTSGLSALYHGAPVKCLGKCLYDLPGLTHQGALDDFWQSAVAPLGSEVLRLRSLLAHEALVPGSFYLGGVTDGSESLVVAKGELSKDQWGRTFTKQTNFGNRQNIHAHPVLE